MSFKIDIKNTLIFFKQIVFIVILVVVSGVLVNYFRTNSLVWVFDVEKAGQEQSKVAQDKIINLQDMIEAVGDNITIIDARTPLFYELGHIPGAINVSPAEIDKKLPKLLADLSENQEIIVYCADPFCLMAETVVENINSSGREAKLFSGGFMAWEDAKQIIESNPKTLSGVN